ncbi:methyltransferase domain-containing protein [Acidipila sp. EB88]|uniref:methyltransferase domain-containing protein n=1 Tax=Acidipila sp. EB88 TaxID=2305226 RepID=UPI000F5F1534|nr:methyltransferase domain-containing protein [Acidipila sp. EB88]RRA48726.1 methyltransferase domain-containing protein [Acidipila sp. EB88]
MKFARKSADEWLDEDHGSAREVASALRSLRFVNRWFGGDRVHHLLLREAVRAMPYSPGPRQEVHVLEVAAGRATALEAASRLLAADGITVRATLLDRQASHLPEHWPRNLPSPIPLQGDALAIPLPARSVDIVSCCLFLHHLEPAEVLVLLGEALRVARVAVVINDLERTPAHFVLAKLFSLVDPSRLSRHDGPVSVRRAYTAGELGAMLAQVDGARVRVRRHFLYRLAGIIWTSQE